MSLNENLKIYIYFYNPLCLYSLNKNFGYVLAITY